MTTTSHAPNLYELEGFGGLRVTYSTTSIAGVPLFNYSYHGKDHAFRGDEIRTQKTEIGQLVTVTLEAVPDLHTITFTLLIPTVNLDEKNEARIQTDGIRTLHRTSIGGPGLVKGQVDLYDFARLYGTAKSVVS